MLESATRSSFSGLPTSAQIGFSSTPDTAPGMAGGTSQDVFNLNTSVGRHVRGVLSAEDVRSAEMAKTMLAAVQKGPAELPESLLSAVFGSRKAPVFWGCGWTRTGAAPPVDLMLEFINVTHRKNRLVGQQKRRTTRRKLLETDRNNVLLDATISIEGANKA